MNVDAAHRKGASGKLVPERESESQFGFKPFWSSEEEAGKSDAELGYFVMDRLVLNTGG